MIKCPNCGASHYTEGPSQRTSLYCPPIWKDGVNQNPDTNITTIEAHCLECDFDFEIKKQNGEIWTVLKSYNPPPPKSNIDITAKTKSVPMDNISLGTATINIETGEAMRQKYKWEVDIEDLQDQMLKLQGDVMHLTNEIAKVNKRFKPKCHHHWIVLYRGRMQVLRRCQYCNKERWFKV